MAIYTKTKGLNNSTLYRRDKKLVKTADVPSNIVDLLEHQASVDDKKLTLQSPYRRCIFDGAYTKLSREVNGETIYICEKDFYDKSIGQLAQQARIIKGTV